jgi:divalent metal cation (Fe/Co/Zn/Cd) transporter
MRWVGHRLQGAATIQVTDAALSDVEKIVHEAEHELGHALPNLDDMVIRTTTLSEAPRAPHRHD